MSSEALAAGMSGRSIGKWWIPSVTLRMTLVVSHGSRPVLARQNPVLRVAVTAADLVVAVGLALPTTAALVPPRITRHGEARMQCRIVVRVAAYLAGVLRVGR